MNKTSSKTIFYLIRECDNISGLEKRELFASKRYIGKILTQLKNEGYIKNIGTNYEDKGKKENIYEVNYEKISEEYIKYIITKNINNLFYIGNNSVPRGLNTYPTPAFISKLFGFNSKLQSEILFVENKNEYKISKIKEFSSQTELCEIFEFKETKEIITRYGSSTSIFIKYCMDQNFQKNKILHLYIRKVLMDELRFDNNLENSLSYTLIDLFESFEMIFKYYDPEFVVFRLNNLYSKDNISSEEIIEYKNLFEFYYFLRYFFFSKQQNRALSLMTSINYDELN